MPVSSAGPSFLPGVEPNVFPVRDYRYECRCLNDSDYCVGHFSIQPLSLTRDIANVHRWVNMDYARYWAMQNTSLEEVTRVYKKLCDTQAVYAGFYNGALAFLIELYDPQRDILRYYYAHQRGDLGMHILMAPATAPIRHFSRTVFTCVMQFLFSLPQVDRVVVEPDARNEKIHRLNLMAGFIYHQRVHLPHKVAALATATRAQFFNATPRMPTETQARSSERASI